MGDTKGTKSVDSIENDTDWLFINEADCIDEPECLNSLEELFDESTNGSVISELIDDADVVDQGNSLALFNEQCTEECNFAIRELKRKYVKSPEQVVAALSPRLEAVKISAEGKSKRRLFLDSGIEDDEAQNNAQVACGAQQGNDCARSHVGDQMVQLLHCSNRKATMLGKFKEVFGVGYNELIRVYKSDKTCSNYWVISVFNATEEVMEASKQLLQKHVEFFQCIIVGFYALYLITFKAGKSRETIVKMFTQILNINDYQLFVDPPKLQSVAVALFFFKNSLSNVSYKYGEYPNWLAKQIMINHQTAASAETFQLSQMVQWAFDNDFTDEAIIAYNYALEAEHDVNAAAFLKSNSQARFVKDCTTMVRLYKRHEMKQMNMAEWIKKCSLNVSEGDWKTIALFLKYQNVKFIEFLIALKPFLQGTPKKNCLVFYGPPDTGKSYFCHSLNSFLQGKIVSYINKNSNFWLSPLIDAKIGFMDDVTYPCWSYIDVNLRSALDGTPVSIDSKHRHPQQIKFPPLLISTNVDVLNENTLMYLHSRIRCFEFKNKLPLTDEGKLVYEITHATWACFFSKFATQLELNCEDDEDGDSGHFDSTFQCSARSNS
uniref:Replication protein E1 n=1 Tax=Human papillomavirus TaxID=10566 RepID=A0A385PNF5_9PAPI|nr:MAG: E1 protein [Human papillomavirus]